MHFAKYSDEVHGFGFKGVSRKPRPGQVIIKNILFDSFCQDFASELMLNFTDPPANLRVFCVATKRFSTALANKNTFAMDDQKRDLGAMGGVVVVDKLAGFRRHLRWQGVNVCRRRGAI